MVTTSQAPLFVLGVHRSGTTWLTSALSRHACCAPVSVRHLIEAVDGEPLSSSEVQQRLIDSGVRVRPGDARPVSPEMTEEYGYLLALAHGSSRTTRRSLPTLQSLIAKVASESPGEVPLLRNPWDYAASHRLRGWLPSARFVFVHRDPVDTVGSAVEMFQDFWRAPHPYGLRASPRYQRAWQSSWKRAAFQWFATRPQLVARMIARGTAFAHRAHLVDSRDLADNRVAHVCYDDLITDLHGTLQSVSTRLDLPLRGLSVPEPPAPRTLPERPWMQSLIPNIRRWTAVYRTSRLHDPHPTE